MEEKVMYFTTAKGILSQKKRHEFISWLHITVRRVFLILPIENLSPLCYNKEKNIKVKQ